VEGVRYAFWLTEADDGRAHAWIAHRELSLAFSSWMGKRAVDCRNQFKIPHDLGTAAKW
jgi:hypothetical protein